MWKISDENNILLPVKIMIVVAAVTLAALGCCGAKSGKQQKPEGKMETNLTINQLKTEFSVLTPKVKYADELEVRVVFSNESSSALRLKTLLLDFPIVLMKVRKADGEDVLLGPPPLPPMDDGVKGREELRPGQSLRYVYHGSEIFSGKELDPGSYEIRFRYNNEYAQGREWKGTIETDWVRFDIEKRED